MTLFVKQPLALRVSAMASHPEKKDAYFWTLFQHWPWHLKIAIVCEEPTIVFLDVQAVASLPKMSKVSTKLKCLVITLMCLWQTYVSTKLVSTKVHSLAVTLMLCDRLMWTLPTFQRLHMCMLHVAGCCQRLLLVDCKGSPWLLTLHNATISPPIGLHNCIDGIYGTAVIQPL